MLLADQQDLNFVTFQSAYVAPTRELLDASSRMASSRSRARCFAVASLLESIGWTSLGAMFDYFPHRAASAFVEKVAVDVNIDDFLREWGHFFDLEWRRYIGSLAEMKKARPPSFAGELNLDCGSEVFDGFLFYVLQLSRNAAATAATAALTFDHPDDIAEYLKPGSSASEMADVLATQAGIHKDSGEIPLAAVYAGFGELVGSVDALLRRSQRLASAYGGRWMSAPALLRKMLQLIRWRFVFIEQQSPLLSGLIDRYLDALEVEEEGARKQFHAHVRALAQTWGHVQGQQGEVAASA